MTKPTIGVIIGSTRAGRFSEIAADWFFTIAESHPDLTFVRVDLRDYNLPSLTEATNPSYLGGVYPDPAVTRFAETVKACDGYIMITPEYNHSISAVLKNALDHIYGEWTNKPVAFISYGSVGGARAVEHARLTAIELQMAPIRNAVHIMAPWLKREADGSLKPGALDDYQKSAESMIEQLHWWTNALKAARLAS